MYNGHKCWSYWNVSLWINNDESLYNYAKWCIRSTTTREIAVWRFMGIYAGKKTPDGANYTKSAVLAAMRGMR